MYIAYLSPQLLSASASNNKCIHADDADLTFHNAQMEGYTAACARLSKEIAAIQRYLPGWLPERPGLK